MGSINEVRFLIDSGFTLEGYIDTFDLLDDEFSEDQINGYIGIVDILFENLNQEDVVNFYLRIANSKIVYPAKMVTRINIWIYKCGYVEKLEAINRE